MSDRFDPIVGARRGRPAVPGDGLGDEARLLLQLAEHAASSTGHPATAVEDLARQLGLHVETGLIYTTPASILACLVSESSKPIGLLLLISDVEVPKDAVFRPTRIGVFTYEGHE